MGILKFSLTQKVMKNYELSNDEKISTPFIFDILQGTVLHTFPDNILDKYSREKFRIPTYTSLANTTPFRTIVFLNLSRSGQGTGYGKDTYIHTYILNIKALILVLGLLQVVGTVKIMI